MIMVTIIIVHFFYWKPDSEKVGIVAEDPQRLIALIPAEGCKQGMRFWNNRYGDLEAATDFLSETKICDKFKK